MTSSVWYRYRPTPIYDLWMSWTYFICQLLLKLMPFSGCLWSVILATSTTISHPFAALAALSASRALHTLLLGLAGSKTNGELRGKTQHFSPVRHWHYSCHKDFFWLPCFVNNLSLFLLNVLLGVSNYWWPGTVCVCGCVSTPSCLPLNLSVAVSQTLKLCILVLTEYLTDCLLSWLPFYLIVSVFLSVSLSLCLFFWLTGWLYLYLTT